MLLVNGCKQHHIIALDRATQFGDGSFTTARVVDGLIYMYDAHLQRLKKACEQLFIQFTQWDVLQEEMCSLAKEVNHGTLKVIISRGSSNSNGYNVNNLSKPNRILSVHPNTHNYNKWRNLGVKLTLSSVRLGRNPMLAGIKHLNRLEQVLIRIHLNNSGADEAVVLDSAGIITECCSANIFWRQGDNVFTPRLDQAGVDGVMRQFFLSKLVNSTIHVVEVNTGIQALWNADEVFICNSLISIVPVRAYKDKIFKSRELYQFLSSLCE